MSTERRMALIHRFLRRLVFALPLALLVIYSVDRWAVPAFVWNGYQAHTEINVLKAPPVDEGAGSHDIYYLASSFDCEAGDLWVVGPPPDADYWMIGIYDLRMRAMPSGHLNHRSVKVDSDGKFRIHITDSPTGADNELDCSSAAQGMLVVRIVRPRTTVVDPVLEVRGT